jgi:hypothetical protein
MHHARTIAAALLLAAPVAGAQQPDSVARARTRADSVAKAIRDSIALMRELGAAVADTTRPAAPGPQGGPLNPRLLPDISAVGDFVADLSPKGSTQEDGARLGVREVELALQAVVDPYFRGDIFLGLSDLEGIAIEQAYLTTTSLPWQLEARLGRFLMPFGKQNVTHRHDLHTIEYPYVIQRFLGAEGLKGTGLYGSRVFSPFGFYQELQVTAVDHLGETEEALLTEEPVNKALSGLGFSARLRNYVDLTEAQNVELSFSAMTGKRAQPLSENVLQFNGVNAAIARQTTLGADLTYRWRPLQQGIYRSFILQGEVMRQLNERRPALPERSCDPIVFTCTFPPELYDDFYSGPRRDYTGAYLFGRYQTSQRSFIGTRYDWLQDADADDRTLQAGSVYLEWFPSEFSKLVAGYEAVKPQEASTVHRLILQAAFSLGPHKPHPF